MELETRAFDQQIATLLEKEKIARLNNEQIELVKILKQIV
jgi:hypothetical protein